MWVEEECLNSGDDLFLTRWMVSHGWNTHIQCCKGAEFLTTVKPSWRFLMQVARWARNTARSDLRSLFMERTIWISHPYIACTMVCLFLAVFLFFSCPPVNGHHYLQLEYLICPFLVVLGSIFVIIRCFKSAEDAECSMPAWYAYIFILTAVPGKL